MFSEKMIKLVNPLLNLLNKLERLTFVNPSFIFSRWCNRDLTIDQLT